MLTKEIKIQIPSSLDEQEAKEWMLVKVERHIRAIKEKEVVSVDDLVKPFVKDFKDKNGIIDLVAPINEFPK